MKLTKKQIETIRANTPGAVKGSQAFPTLADFGHFTPAGANWSYCAGFIEYNGGRVLVVKMRGEII